MHDELFTPTIRDRPRPGKPPWRPESIIYPAFFGGPLTAAALGVLNGRRLALPRAHLLGIAGAGLAAFAARVVVSAFVDSPSGVRLAGSAFGVLAWLAVLFLQRRPFRVAVLRGAAPAGLIVPGLAAVVACGLFEAVVIFGLVR